MKTGDPEKIIEWLSSGPPLSELQAEFPEEWESACQDMAKSAGPGGSCDFQAYLSSSAAKGEFLKKMLGKGGDRRTLSEYASHQVRNRMAYLAVKQHYISVATGIEKGKVKFNLINGLLAQFLFFSQGLV